MDHPARPKRSSVFIDAHMGRDDQRAPMQLVRIRDLSEGGARIEGEAPPIGARIILSRGILEIEARVVWASGRHFGVAFDETVSVDAIMRAVGQARSPARPIHAAALTAEPPRPPSLPPRRRPLPADRATFGLRVAAPR